MYYLPYIFSHKFNSMIDDYIMKNRFFRFDFFGWVILNGNICIFHEIFHKKDQLFVNYKPNWKSLVFIIIMGFSYSFKELFKQEVIFFLKLLVIRPACLVSPTHLRREFTSGGSFPWSVTKFLSWVDTGLRSTDKVRFD